MISKYLGAALIGSALLAGPALAQTASQNEKSASSAVHKEGQWRSSKVIGVNVYNDANEKIGEIEEIIINKSGKIDNVILSVGGFLGIGEHHVAVPLDKLKWVNEPVRATTATNTRPTPTAPATNVDSTSRTAADGPRTTTGTGPTRSARAANEQWYPDHAVYNATKDQLKALPAFKYN